MTSITEFLLERIAEDENLARAVIADMPRWDSETWESAVLEVGEDLPGPILTARYSPVRVLAECAAKRAILELHPLNPYYGLDQWGRWLPREGEPKMWFCDCQDDDGIIQGAGPCVTLRAMTAVYADHPDFDEEWAND
jgi:hypothetical protein